MRILYSNKFYRTIAFVSCIFFFSNIVRAQFTGAISGYHPVLFPQKLYMLQLFADGETIADSASITSQGNFAFQNKVNAVGVYELRFAYRTKGVRFVFNPAEIIQAKLSVSSLDEGKQESIFSKENEFYALLETLKQRNDSLLQKSDSIMKTVSYFDPKSNARSATLREAYTKFSLLQNKTIRQLKEKYKGTFTADVLAGFYLIPLRQEFPQTDTAFDNNLSFSHYHYFDNLNLTTPLVLNCNLLAPKLEAYLKSYVNFTNFETTREGIDELMKHCSADKEVKSFVTNWLLNYFNKKNDLQTTEHIFNTYYNTGCETDADGNLGELITRMKAVAPGSLAPDIQLPGESGKTLSLYSLKDKKAVVVFFWASWCPHCTQAIIDVKKMYDIYSPQGLEIYAISLDYTRAEWQKYLTDKPIRWKNVAEGIGPKTEITKIFGVHSTPTFFLLDGNMKILLRSHELSDLDKKLKELF